MLTNYGQLEGFKRKAINLVAFDTFIFKNSNTTGFLHFISILPPIVHLSASVPHMANKCVALNVQHFQGLSTGRFGTYECFFKRCFELEYHRKIGK